MIPLALLLWSIAGFCLAYHDASHGWSARLRPVWLRTIVLRIAEGPLWLLLDCGWRVISRPRPDRD